MLGGVTINYVNTATIHPLKLSSTNLELLLVVVERCHEL